MIPHNNTSRQSIIAILCTAFIITTVSLENSQIEKLVEDIQTDNPLKGRCPENEYWTNCTGCELSCDQDENTPCPTICNPPSCECRAFMGFRRAPDGKCIHKEDCPPEATAPSAHCTILEEYRECGTACEETCESMGEELPCTKQCVSGCFCKENFVREREGGCCIPRHLCKSKEATICGPNQEYQECGTACPETCEGKPDTCTLHCEPGCFCKKGFVLNGTKCIPKKECPDATKTQCGENEEYQRCGSACPETCVDNETAVCTLECVPGCFCQTGYILDQENGTCVKRELCKPPKYLYCPENEVFTFCGGCEGTCHQQFVPCPDICGSPRCECPAQKNFVRDDFGACIDIKNCNKE